MKKRGTSNKETEYVRKYQREITELKSTVTILKNTLDGFTNRLGQVRRRNKGLRNRMVTFIQSKEHKEKNNSDNILWGLWDTIKWTSICIIGIPEREERKKEAECLFKETMIENALNLGEETGNCQRFRKLRIPNKKNSKRHSPRHIIIKLSIVKYKERILNADYTLDGEHIYNIQIMYYRIVHLKWVIINQCDPNKINIKKSWKKWYWGNWTATSRKTKSDNSLTTYTKINLKWIRDLNVRPESLKLLHENRR